MKLGINLEIAGNDRVKMNKHFVSIKNSSTETCHIKRRPTDDARGKIKMINENFWKLFDAVDIIVFLIFVISYELLLQWVK